MTTLCAKSTSVVRNRICCVECNKPSCALRVLADGSDAFAYKQAPLSDYSSCEKLLVPDCVAQKAQTVFPLCLYVCVCDAFALSPSSTRSTYQFFRQMNNIWRHYNAIVGEIASQIKINYWAGKMRRIMCACTPHADEAILPLFTRG